MSKENSSQSFETQVLMRDGVLLATTVHLPATLPAPVVLVRTPYDRTACGDGGFPSRGLAFVTQDARGRYDSEGEFYPFTHEENDEMDTLDWIAAQSWCNRRIGMLGDSYLAATQLVLAPQNHPALVALNPRFMCGNIWQHCFYCDGAFSFALAFSWLCLEVGARQSRAGVLPTLDVPKILRHLPLQTLDEKLGSGVVASYRDYLAHETKDDFWQVGNWRENLQHTSAPTLLVGGWYDYYAGETFRNFAALQKSEQKSEIPSVASRH